MKIINDIINIQCLQCGKVHKVKSDLFELNVDAYPRHMGPEYEYTFYHSFKCPCRKPTSDGTYITLQVFEYPKGIINLQHIPQMLNGVILDNIEYDVEENVNA